MDTGSILLILSLALVTFLVISRPILDKRAETLPLISRQTARTEDHEASALLAERDRLLNALQELDGDHELGKLDQDEYAMQRASLIAAGGDVMKKLEQTEGSIKQQRSASAPSSLEDDVEQMIADRKRSRPEKSAGFCPKCGKPAQKSDKFCSRCGTVLS